MASSLPLCTALVPVGRTQVRSSRTEVLVLDRSGFGKGAAAKCIQSPNTLQWRTEGLPRVHPADPGVQVENQSSHEPVVAAAAPLMPVAWQPSGALIAIPTCPDKDDEAPMESA